jgi:hypothetical protein
LADLLDNRVAPNLWHPGSIAWHWFIFDGRKIANVLIEKGVTSEKPTYED